MIDKENEGSWLSWVEASTECGGREQCDSLVSADDGMMKLLITVRRWSKDIIVDSLWQLTAESVWILKIFSSVFINLLQLSLTPGPGFLVWVWAAVLHFPPPLRLNFDFISCLTTVGKKKKKNYLDAVGVNQSACLKIIKRMHFW